MFLFPDTHTSPLKVTRWHPGEQITECSITIAMLLHCTANNGFSPGTLTGGGASVVTESNAFEVV